MPRPNRISDRVGYILERSIPEPNTGCWLWLLSTGSHGYGQCIDPEDPERYAGKNVRVTTAHRVSHLAFKGPIPPAYQINHLCRNIICCNPDHLEAVPQLENVSRQWAAMRCEAA